MSMSISEAIIQELKQILKEDYGKEATQAEISEIAYTLIRYFDLLAKIYHRKITKNNYDDDKPRNN